MITKFSVHTTNSFLRDMKRFVKKKKFIKLKDEIFFLQAEKLGKGVFEGEVITHLAEGRCNPIYKLRMANTTINVGLSNGFRLIYHVEHDQKIVVLHTIYYKKEENLTSNEIIRFVESNRI